MPVMVNPTGQRNTCSIIVEMTEKEAMKNTNAHRMSLEDETLLWRLWHSGQSLHRVARGVGISAASVPQYLDKHGGYCPAPRRRRSSFLCAQEREEISRWVAAGLSVRAIAAKLDRTPSTISRELARNGGRETYRAGSAERRAWDQARRPKRCVLACNGRLRRAVEGKLRKNWSPEQISGWLKDHYPDNERMRVSAETIYKSLFIQSRGALKKDLKDHLRTKRRFRQARTKSRKGHGYSSIVDGVSIRERPAEIEDRALPGHWEGDLIAGDQSSFIATVVERKTRFVVLVKVRNKETEEVVAALIKQMRKLPTILKQTLTWDRGAELAAHKQFALATDMDVYFCDPASPWQRGSNENTNGLLRQYFPKGEDVSHYTQAQLNKVAKSLNTRPRKTLGFKTPAYELSKVLR